MQIDLESTGGGGVVFIIFSTRDVRVLESVRYLSTSIKSAATKSRTHHKYFLH